MNGHSTERVPSGDVLQIRVLNDEATKGVEAVDTQDDTFLKKIEMGMLSQISLQVSLSC